MLSVGIIPPKHRESWLDSVLREIAFHQAVTSRGKRKIRGVKKEPVIMGQEKEEIPSISHVAQRHEFLLTKQYWTHV